ncbi:bacillithiol biosynthesis cysteine-adding enzyme BshC [Pelobium manganitolerans]|uniref:Putative cysteine ligase BshC n=1 Tax=Pelobium manganitolerans TaxID=1842495 RepID=A0A419S757_9SPHI|nr:bacillithiol biosynthesis cysteine-adding enzyme BshC [Pelobium manganitolerans]RKD17168.1 bacillithiol biosynthesis cysteine-adding enzyme BshC [Pelobium manganitolerans]
MKVSTIDYEETGCFSATVTRLLGHDGSLAPFVNGFASLQQFQQIIAQRKFSGNRGVLHDVLSGQYKNLELSPALQNNIASLKNQNTYTVTTGHQLNIFGGPLYFIFKIVSTIKLAQELAHAYPEQHFVPVYWMATEDHDFAEINHTYLSNEKISWEYDVSGATGKISTDSIAQASQHYIRILGISANASTLAEMLKNAYAGRKTLAEATRIFVNELFGEYGLVIIDADEPALKQLFAPIIEKDIIGQHSFRCIEETSAKLATVGISAQVNPREINFFYLKDSSRERIVFDAGRYKVLNSAISFSEEELKAEIEKYPERFSPNVVMRPLYQEYILPNLAYIGGGGELAYWLQLKSTFEYYQTDFPLLVLRNSAMLLNDKILRKMSKLRLKTADLFKSAQNLQTELIASHTAHRLNLVAEKEALSQIFHSLKNRIALIDVTLRDSTEAVETRLQKAMDKLEKKILRAEKRNHAEVMGDIEQLKNQLFPGGGLQERKENFGLFYVEHGKNFIPQLLASFDPLAFKFSVLA